MFEDDLEAQASEVDEVASLLIPVEQRMLLLPTVSVAEMVPWKAPVPVLNAPDWFLGMFLWREQQVPLLSFEVINGEARADIHSRCRVAILNNTGESDELPFIAVATQGIPRLARVNDREISQIEDANCKPFELMHVSLAGEQAVIPNIAALEQAYLGYQRPD